VSSENLGKGKRPIIKKVVDIFGNDTNRIIKVEL